MTRITCRAWIICTKFCSNINFLNSIASRSKALFESLSDSFFLWNSAFGTVWSCTSSAAYLVPCANCKLSFFNSCKISLNASSCIGVKTNTTWTGITIKVIFALINFHNEFIVKDAVLLTTCLRTKKLGFYFITIWITTWFTAWCTAYGYIEAFAKRCNRQKWGCKK